MTDDLTNDDNQTDMYQPSTGPLPHNGDTPFSAPDDQAASTSIADDDSVNMRSSLDPTHPATDTDIEPGEVYDQGLSGAANASEPNGKDTVISYDPNTDSRR